LFWLEIFTAAFLSKISGYLFEYGQVFIDNANFGENQDLIIIYGLLIFKADNRRILTFF
jgi:hypothetical protein